MNQKNVLPPAPSRKTACNDAGLRQREAEDLLLRAIGYRAALRHGVECDEEAARACLAQPAARAALAAWDLAQGTPPQRRLVPPRMGVVLPFRGRR